MARIDVAVKGQRIVEIRPMTKKELEFEGWDPACGMHSPPLMLVLENGLRLYASQDDEGNGPGAFFGLTEEGQGFGLA